MNYKKK